MTLAVPVPRPVAHGPDPGPPAQRPEPGAVLDVVVPIYNEERMLAGSIRRLRAFLDASLPFPVVVTIADNGSTDGSPGISRGLAAELPGVRYLRLEEKGRGLALRTAWSATEAPYVAYMDVDLSTSLDALVPLVVPLLAGECDLAIGSRLARGAVVTRSFRREVLSRGYNLLLRACLRSRFSDAQCGFKAMTASLARHILPDVVDDNWFFDTELLIRAQRSDLRIHELAVEWVEDPDSSVALLRTVREDLRGILRLRRAGRQSVGMLPLAPATMPGPVRSA